VQILRLRTNAYAPRDSGIDVAVTLTLEPPNTSPDTSTATLAPQGLYLPPNVARSAIRILWSGCNVAQLAYRRDSGNRCKGILLNATGIPPRTAVVTLDGSGGGIAKVGPLSAREVWYPDNVAISVTGFTKASNKRCIWDRIPANPISVMFYIWIG